MTESAKTEFDRLTQLLKEEEIEDRLQYKEKLLNYPVQERKKQGITWYPIVIKETSYTMGERLVLEIERPTDHHLPHMFTSGRTAQLFSNQDSDQLSIPGVISAVRENALRITLAIDELPEWVSKGKLGVDLLFDETSYKEMFSALKKVGNARNDRIAELRDITLGLEKATFSKSIHEISIKHLNHSQNKALNNALAANDIAIIHGPPGTGKTTTLIEAIIETVNKEKQVLVCAPSNNAIDLLTEILDARGIRVVRLGNPARVGDHLQTLTLDAQIANHQDYKYIKDLRKRSAEFRNMALKYKRHFGKAERDQRKALLDESYKMQTEAQKTEGYIAESLLDKAQVIACTLVGSSFHMMRDRNFKTVFIDEAAQALEPACWIPILKAEKVVFAGDHCQLPPTVKSYKAGKQGLNITLFEKCMEKQQVDVMLETQYRMNQKIMAFSNTEFYKEKLIAAESVADRVLGGNSAFEILSTPVEFIDTAGCSYNEEAEFENVSLYNTGEMDILFQHLKSLYTALEADSADPENVKVGIISPYKAQVTLMKEKIKELPEVNPYLHNITINTVDGFQGQERDVIYISLVRSNAGQEIGFLADYRRMNVALTRAKKKLVVIGDSSTLARDAFYNRFFEYVEKINAYKSAWEYIST